MGSEYLSPEAPVLCEAGGQAQPIFAALFFFFLIFFRMASSTSTFPFLLREIFL